MIEETFNIIKTSLANKEDNTNDSLLNYVGTVDNLINIITYNVEDGQIDDSERNTLVQMSLEKL